MSDQSKVPENLADEFRRQVDYRDDDPWSTIPHDDIARFVIEHAARIEAALRRATPDQDQDCAESRRDGYWSDSCLYCTRDQEPVLAEVIGHEGGWVLMIGNHVVDGYGFEKTRAVRDAESINSEYARMRTEGELP